MGKNCYQNAHVSLTRCNYRWAEVGQHFTEKTIRKMKLNQTFSLQNCCTEDHPCHEDEGNCVEDHDCHGALKCKVHNKDGRTIDLTPEDPDDVSLLANVLKTCQ